MIHVLPVHSQLRDDNGYLITSEAVQSGVSKPSVSKYIREYSHICFTVPIGYNATHIKNKNKEVRYANAELIDMGTCEVPSSSGNMVKVYNMERCICDLIKDRKKYEVQLYQTAMKEYMSSKEKNLTRLVEYANKLGVRDKL